MRGTIMEDIISDLIDQLNKAEQAGLPTDEIQARLDEAHAMLDEYGA